MTPRQLYFAYRVLDAGKRIVPRLVLAGLLLASAVAAVLIALPGQHAVAAPPVPQAQPSLGVIL